MKIKILGVLAVLGVLATNNVMAAEHKHSKDVTPNKHVVTKQVVTKTIVNKKVVNKQIIIKHVVKTPSKQPARKVAHNQHNKNVTVIVRR